MGLSRTDSIPVGQQIRDLRRAKGLRIAGLASEIGRSVGHVSQVERGLSPVTIPDLKKIADALGVEINWFFQGQAMAPPEERDIIVRRANRRELNYSGTGVREALLSPHLHGTFEMVMTTLEPGADSGVAYSRTGEEGGFVLEGTLDLEVDGRKYSLSAGDSFSFESTRPHRCANSGSQVTHVLWVISPPSY
ncbi:cupin domain-containing protein [Alphaproteobacteria bacterium HT1-32]|nr:cupin domain-containing protein [Alphaproteobacteria bacterium HT1-32]